MSFEEKLQQIKQQVEGRIQQALSRAEPASLYAPMRYLLESGGKRLRPVLVCLACEAVGGQLSDCLDAAVAVELLHNFTLVHDDIMDQDDLRRGRPTVHRKWDINVALLSGDGLVALSYKFLLQNPHPRLSEIGTRFSAGLLRLCEGQALDKEFESRDRVSMAEYFEMIDKKTATLLSLCAELGALFGNGQEEDVRSLSAFGRNLGLGFQIQDDLLDITATEEILGKTYGSDIRQRKKTFLLIHALENAQPEDQEIIRRIYCKDSPITQRDILTMKEVFERSGSLEAAGRWVERKITEARENLLALPDTPARSHLYRLLDIVLKREY